MALVLTLSGYTKIYDMNISTRKVTQLTKGWSIDTEPAWSPDEKSLVFTSSRGGSAQIYRYDFANKKVHRVTFRGAYNASASFMPDGSDIIVLHRQNRVYHVAKVNLKTGQTLVLDESGQAQSPSLSPNGKMVIFASRYGARGVLQMVSTDGRVSIRLPAREGNVREPVWSPFVSG